MKFRSWFTYVGALALGLLFLIGVVSLLHPSAGAVGRSVAPQATRFLPRQAPLVLSLLAKPEDLSTYRRFLEAKDKSGTNFSQPLQQLLTRSGLSYSKDIQPWLGHEITLAITTLDIDRQPKNGQQLGYLMALEVDDIQRSREFLDIFWQKQASAGQELNFEKYQGVNLISTQGKRLNWQPTGKREKAAPGLNAVATALVGKQFLLISNDSKVVRDAINNLQATDLELATASYYQQAVESLKSPRLGFAFVNLPELAHWQGKSLQPGLNTAPPIYDRLALTLGADRAGLLIETALIAKANPEAPVPQPQFKQPGMSLKYIPNDSALVLAGLDLETTWTQLSQGLQGYPQVANLLSQSLSDAGRRWGLDLRQDIFNWVRGEYSLGIIPVSTEPGNSPTLDWVFISENAPPEVTQQGIRHLDQIAEQQGFTAGPINSEGEPVIAWTKLLTESGQTRQKTKDSKVASTLLQAEVVGTHMALEDYSLLASSLAAMNQAVDFKQHSLMADPGFKKATAPLATPNNGYLYLDWPKLRPLLEQKFPLLQTLEGLATPFVNHLRSVSLVSLGRQERIQRGQIFIRLD